MYRAYVRHFLFSTYLPKSNSLDPVRGVTLSLLVPFSSKVPPLVLKTNPPNLTSTENEPVTVPQSAYLQTLTTGSGQRVPRGGHGSTECPHPSFTTESVPVGETCRLSSDDSSVTVRGFGIEIRSFHRNLDSRKVNLEGRPQGGIIFV